MEPVCSRQKRQTGPQQNITIILHDYGQSLKEYAHRGKENLFPRPEECPYCERGNRCVIGWGFYERWAIGAEGTYRIPIKVWKCRRQHSGGYISMLPSFLVPNHQYTLDTIYDSVKRVVCEGMALVGSLKAVFGKQAPSYQLLQWWLEAMEKRASEWIGLLQGEANNPIPPPSVALPAGIAQEVAHLLKIMEKSVKVPEDSAGLKAHHAQWFNRYRAGPIGGQSPRTE